ncbi:hypothetical protein ZWY2020_003408 [Hordeum vulgare]|nr:hypothetical protein ZWY2020_003408 [Hordeum vulgare]
MTSSSRPSPSLTRRDRRTRKREIHLDPFEAWVLRWGRRRRGRSPRGAEEARGSKQQWLVLRLRDLSCTSTTMSRAHGHVITSASVHPAVDDEQEDED